MKNGHFENYLTNGSEIGKCLRNHHNNYIIKIWSDINYIKIKNIIHFLVSLLGYFGPCPASIYYDSIYLYVSAEKCLVGWIINKLMEYINVNVNLGYF